MVVVLMVIAAVSDYIILDDCPWMTPLMTSIVVDAYHGDKDKFLEEKHITPLCGRSHRQAVRVEASHQTEYYEQGAWCHRTPTQFQTSDFSHIIGCWSSLQRASQSRSGDRQRPVR